MEWFLKHEKELFIIAMVLILALFVIVNVAIINYQFRDKKDSIKLKNRIDDAMKDIADELQKEAMPFESWVYEVKRTHQIIRKHLEKFSKE